MQMTFADNISYSLVKTKVLIRLFESLAFLYRWSAGYVFYQLILYDNLYQSKVFLMSCFQTQRITDAV